MKAIPADYLPPKFTDQERYAYKWLRDCQIRGWIVDLLTKRVTFVDEHDCLHQFNSLVSFAEFHGLTTPAR